MVQEVKNLPAMQETQDTQVWSLGGEDPLEKEMTTCSNMLVWKIHGQRNLVVYSPWGTKGLNMTGPTYSRYRYYRGENQFSERLSNLPKNTQLGSIGVGGRIQVCLPLGPC